MGEVFAGRYELVDPVGRGGAGAVWRAWDHRRRRYVAAKVLQQSDAHALLRFVREQALRIDHPHVLAPASWSADDDKVLFTMDLVAGGSLVHLVGDYGPLPPAFVCTLLDQLLSGLAAVHAEGVVHRDVKPANVLLEATGTARPRLRLSDFGVAMRLGEPRLTETDYVVGTPGYLAPEQLMGSEPDFTADLFAVGLVALYLLEGARPDSRALVRHFTAHGTPGAPRGVPGPLWEVVATLLQPDPAARFRTATGARKALAAARELLPEPGSDGERTEIFEVEIFDQIGPLPRGFGPEGPLSTPSGVVDPASAGPHGTDTMGVGPEETPSGAAGGAPKPPPPVVPGAGGEARPLGPGAIPPRPVTAPVSPGAGASAVAPGPPFPAVGPGSTPPALPPRPSVDPTPPPRPPALSDTGSFHLPPPLPRETMPRPPGQPPAPPAAAVATGPVPARAAPHEPTWQPGHTPSAGPHTAPSLAVRGPAPAHTAAPSSQAPTRPGGPARHGRRPATRRPGPPAKIALPVLLLALLCFAVGFWALARV